MVLVSPEIVAELTRMRRQRLLDEAEADRALRASRPSGLASGLLKAAHTALTSSSSDPSHEGDAPADTRTAACPAPHHAT
jgi:hypothetical protein